MQLKYFPKTMPWPLTRPNDVEFPKQHLGRRHLQHLPGPSEQRQPPVWSEALKQPRVDRIGRVQNNVHPAHATELFSSAGFIRNQHVLSTKIVQCSPLVVGVSDSYDLGTKRRRILHREVAKTSDTDHGASLT